MFFRSLSAKFKKQEFTILFSYLHAPVADRTALSWVELQFHGPDCTLLGWTAPKNIYYNHRIIKRQNGKRYKGKPNMVQSALARRIRQGCTGPTPPPSPNSCIGLLRNFVCAISRNFHEIFNFVFAKCSLNFVKNKIILSKFCVLRNFDKIIFNLAKLKKNLAKHEIKNFAKIS